MCGVGTATIHDGEIVEKMHTLTLTVTIDDANHPAVIDLARRLYSEAGGASEMDDDGIETPIPAERFIATVDDALMEILEHHPTFESAGIEIRSMSGEAAVVEEESEAGTDTEAADSLAGEDDLDDFAPGTYLCRWPNGEFSVVEADSKRDAIVALDEWAGAHPRQVGLMDRFMADFKLTDEGEIILNQFGEATREEIWDTCYPTLRDSLSSSEVIDDGGNIKPGATEVVRRAVEHERKRLWENQPEDEPKTELGKRLAKTMGTSAVVADHYVEEIGRELLEHDDDEQRKPN